MGIDVLPLWVIYLILTNSPTNLGIRTHHIYPPCLSLGHRALHCAGRSFFYGTFNGPAWEMGFMLLAGSIVVYCNRDSRDIPSFRRINVAKGTDRRLLWNPLFALNVPRFYESMLSSKLHRELYDNPFLLGRFNTNVTENRKNRQTINVICCRSL